MTGCKFPGCDKKHKSRGYCAAHYTQLRRKEPLRALRVWSGDIMWTVSKGYLVRFSTEGGKTRSIYQHREVMEQMLGRPLLSHESVHHKNGDRQDNRPENLELWSTYQPKGQRVEDKLEWAREIIALYG